MTGLDLYRKVLQNKKEYIGKIINVIDGHYFVKGCKFKVLKDSESDYIAIDLIYKPYNFTADGIILTNMLLQSKVDFEE